jgi:hypothetical protein
MFLFHAHNFILPFSFWQAFFAPKEHPKIARSFNCGSTPPKNKAPPGRQTKPLRKILPPLRGLRIFTASNPQLKLRAILIHRPATAPQIGFFFAQIEKWPHGWDFARTDGKLARTKRQMSRTERIFAARMGKPAHGTEVASHGLPEWLREANFARTNRFWVKSARLAKLLLQNYARNANPRP